jgi:hypothetical protein
MATGGSIPKVSHLQEHDSLLWKVVDDGLHGPFEIVNVDAHSDLAMFNGQLDIGNFISKMVDLGLVDRVTWIKDRSSMEFVDGTYNFTIGKVGHGLRLGSSLSVPFYFLNEDYAPRNALVAPRELALTVITDLSNTAPRGNKWILSVDYDYFACRNPYAKDLEQLMGMIGAQTISTLYAKGSTIRTLVEWQEFRNEINKLAPGVFEAVARCLLPSFTYSDEEIMGKVVELSSFICKSRDINNCLGIYLIGSVGSGFTDPTKYGEIDKCVKEWLSVLQGNPITGTI